MTRQELMKKLENLKEREFLINMVDRWTNEDRKMLDEVKKEILEVKKLLAIA